MKAWTLHEGERELQPPTERTFVFDDKGERPQSSMGTKNDAGYSYDTIIDLVGEEEITRIQLCAEELIMMDDYIRR